ncbi:DNA circularization N-terminal domain-containing protein [Bosea eneae]|uniref:DNA circularization N-terminal domain-containing protein n=1 Tax=Bosea eneae TaxID=151454 RepID=A0ABW0IRV0_9HYPH
MLNFANPGSLLPGLRPAAWRGVTFWVIDASHTVGRRIHATLYPGLDLKTHDDTGPLDGPIRLSGLIIGDDYVSKAEALGRAFRSPGSGTLMHPWRGPIDCVLLRPAEISFAADELRVARVECEFDPTGDGPLGGLAGGLLGGLLGGAFGSLTGLLGAVGGLLGAATGLIGSVLSVALMPLSIFSFAVGAVGTVFSIASNIVGAVVQAAVLVPLARGLAGAFSRAIGNSDRRIVAASLADLVGRYPATLGAAFRPQPPAALGPSAESAALQAAGLASAGTAGTARTAAQAPAPEPRAGASLMFTIAAVIAARAADPSVPPPPGGSGNPVLDAVLAPFADPVAARLPGISDAIAAGAALASAGLPGRAPVTATERLIYLAAETAFVSEAVSLMAEIEFESRQEAQAWQGWAELALSGASTRAAGLAGEAPAVVAALWQGLEATSARLAIDMSEVVGRLPAVLSIEPPRAGAWLLAQHYAGDDPRQVVPMLHDIVRRNRLRHPAVLGAGPIEVLKP